MNNTQYRNIKSSYIFITFTIFLTVMSIILLLSSFGIRKNVNEMQENTNEYITGQDSISQMREVSDYLTEKCQSFIVTGNINDAKDYFKEITVDQRREASLKSVEKYGKQERTYTSLANALEASNELADVEVYAMRLAADGYGIDPADISEELTAVKLSNADQALDPSAQVRKSTDMVFDESYDQKKTEIWEDVYSSTTQLMENTRAREVASYNSTHRQLIIQILILVILIVLAIALLTMVYMFIIMPLRDSTKYIRNNEPLPEHGVSEYIYLAEAYNKMLDATQQQHEILSYEATHDELTDLYNRKFFEMKRAELTSEDTALMIIDVDLFKTINDTYGHEVGDKVLQKVSGMLSSCFRSGDYVCRIGGDEFAVLMVKMRPELKHVIRGKVDRLNELIRSAHADGLPAVTLSIGVAFSDNHGDAPDTPEALFNRADQALYYSKEHGRDRYSFFDEIINA